MNRKLISAFAILILVISLPVTIFLIKHQNESRSHAAAPDQLEAEGGTLSSTGVSKQTDSAASGSQYVAFVSQTQTPTPTPTSIPTSQTGIGPRLASSTPTGSNVFVVPSTIDKTGNTDVAASLQNWVNSQPNGTATSPTILIFPSGSIYKISKGIRVDSRKYITFWGYGSTIRATGPGDQSTSSGFYLRESDFIKVLGFTIKGENSLAGTPQAYGVGGEYAMGVLGYQGTSDIEIADNHILNVYGDGVYFNSFDLSSTDRWNIHHNLIELTGRQGVVPDQGEDIYIERNIIRDIAMSSIDAEDQRNGEAYLRRVYVRNNIIDRWMHYGTTTSYYSCHAFPMDYGAGQIGEMRDIYIENNTFQGGCIGPGNTFAQSTSDADISLWGDAPKSNIFIRNNTFNLPSNQRAGWAIRLKNVNGGQITGNTIPGQTVQCQNCTNVTKQ